MPKANQKRVNGKRAKEPKSVSELGRILRKLAEQYRASGGKFLSRGELEREIAERRGLR